MTEYPLYRKIADPIVRAWFHHIYLNAHRYKYGWLQINTGRSRSGKTETNILMAALLSRVGFNENNIAWRPKEYLQSLEDAKPGEPVVWTEMGTGLNARQWQKLGNILTTETMQVMMIKKPIVLMDVIDLSFVDVQVRKLARVYCEIHRPSGNPAYVRLFNINTNYRTGEIYYPHPLVNVDGRFIKLTKIVLTERLKEIAPNVWTAFKEKELAYKERLRQKHTREVAGIDKEVGSKTVFDYIAEIKENPLKYQLKGKWSASLIKTEFRVSQDFARDIRAQLLRESATTN